MQERQPRIQPNLMVNKYVDGVPYLTKVRNVSESGVALSETIEPVHRRGALVLVELSLDNGETPLWLTCEQARTTDSGYTAFSFSGLGVAERRCLRKYIERHRSDLDLASSVLNS